MRRQTLYNRAHIILPMVFRDFRYNYVAFSHVAPNDFVNLVHKIHSMPFITLSINLNIIRSLCISGYT